MKKLLLIAAPLAGLLAAILLFASLIHVPAGSIGVLAKGEELRILEPGLHFGGPFQDPPEVYSLTLGPQEGEIQARTGDGVSLPLGFTISGTLEPSQADAFHRARTGRTVPELLQWVGGEAVARVAISLPAAALVREDPSEASQAVAGELFEPAGVGQVRLQVRGDSPEALLVLVRALAPENRSPLLRERVEAALLGEGARDWHGHAALGLILESEGDPRQAERHYLDSLLLDPTALPPMAQLYRLYMAVGEESRLLRLLSASLEEDPSSVQHLVWATAAHLQQGELDAARAAAERALSLQPDNVNLLNNLGGVHLKSGDLDRAIATFREAAGKVPGDRQTLYNLGAALAAHGSHQEALQHLLQAEKAGPAGRPLLEAIASAYRGIGQTRKAAEYDALARSRPDPAGD